MLVVWNRDYLGQISFQLSFASTAGILWTLAYRRQWLGQKDESNLAPALAGMADLEDQVSQPGVLQRFSRWFKEGVLVSLAAQSLTAPLLLYHFGELSLIGVLANLAFVWLVPIIMIGGFVVLGIATLVEWWLTPLSPFALLALQLIGQLIAVPAQLFLVLLEGFGVFGWSVWRFDDFSFWWVIVWWLVVYGLFLFFSTRLSRRHRLQLTRDYLLDKSMLTRHVY